MSFIIILGTLSFPTTASDVCAGVTLPPWALLLFLCRHSSNGAITTRALKARFLQYTDYWQSRYSIGTYCCGDFRSGVAWCRFWRSIWRAPTTSGCSARATTCIVSYRMHSKRRRHSVLCVSSAGVRNLGWSISASRSYRLTVVHECHCRFRAGVGGPSPSCWEGLRLLFLEFGSGARHEGPKPEAQSAESGVRFLGVGSHLEGLWKRYKLPSGARGRGPAAIWFSCVLEAPDGLS